MAKKIMPIKFVRQRGKTDCVSACLAMVLGKPLTEVKKLYHKNNGLTTFDIKAAFANEKRMVIEYVDPIMWPGRMYMIAVPSLNTPDRLHQVVVDWRDPCRAVVYDPNHGRKDKKFYWKFSQVQHCCSAVVEVARVIADVEWPE